MEILPDSNISNEIGHKEFRFFDSHEISNMIQNNVIQDCYTLITYTRYQLKLW